MTNNPQLINDWYSWHKKFNFDEIVIFNNSPNLFKIDGTTEIDCKSLEAPQLKCYQSFIDQLPLNSWVLFLDDDELLDLEGDVHDFLKPYNNCDTVRLNWRCYGDNGELRYRQAPIWERFPEPCAENVVYNDKLPNGITENWHVKSFYKRTFKPAQAGVHTPIIPGGCAVNTRMEPQIANSPFQEICWERAFIRHYNTLSTEEWCERRLNRIDACGNRVATKEELIRFYRNENVWSNKKEEIVNAYLRGNTETVR